MDSTEAKTMYEQGTVGRSEIDPSPIQSANIDLRGAIDALGEVITVLGDRLHPVLRPAEPMMSDEAANPRAMCSEQVEFTVGQADRIAGLNRTLQEYLKRLET